MVSTITTRRPSRPTTTHDLWRLAALGRQRGLRVFEASPNRWFCSSASDRFRLYALSGFSCTCPGFWHHGRCSHHALLLSELDWLPPLEPEPPAVTCAECGGCGVVYVHACEVANFPHPICGHCHGAGRVAGQVIAA
jgi:hypothetical protein